MFSGEAPRHFVSYSASDQVTVRELTEHYDGILVPGTVATFQREGTAGFVLTLSARGISPPYVIDPRFPLFQQALPTAKPSHTALAVVLGDRALVREDQPSPEEFGADRINRIAEAWVNFNLGYRREQSARFEKYADRLGETLSISDASAPQRILAPYFCVTGTADPWHEKSVALYEATTSAAKGNINVTRVLSAQSADGLGELKGDGQRDDVCIWVSGLSELEAEPHDLAAYATAIRLIHGSQRRTFALYGGFFAVMLSAVGLGGHSHGIGYGEHREWGELPRSGAPRARYYLPTVHRYAQQDDAQSLWLYDPALVADGPIAPPIEMGYHDLMLHSVKARAREIGIFGPLSLEETIERLDLEYREFIRRLEISNDRVLLRIGVRLSDHIPRWLKALRLLG